LRERVFVVDRGRTIGFGDSGWSERGTDERFRFRRLRRCERERSGVTQLR
jgi:hypothetical protein